jgi:hypothetical protein
MIHHCFHVCHPFCHVFHCDFFIVFVLNEFHDDTDEMVPVFGSTWRGEISGDALWRDFAYRVGSGCWCTLRIHRKNA